MTGLTVLCIDNEPAVLRGMHALLEGWGCSVITAQSAAEAVGQLNEKALGPTSSWPTITSTTAPASKRWRPCAPPPARRRP